MEKIDIDDVDSWMGPASVKRPIGRALGADDVAINYYELEPGESFAFGYHKHADQEEVFHVLDGEVTFETDAVPGGSADANDDAPGAEGGVVTVGAGELIRFAPGEWQRGVNEGDARVRALALGAPRESGETVIRRRCEDCGERTEQEIERASEGDALVTVCVDCGAETGRFD